MTMITAAPPLPSLQIPELYVALWNEPSADARRTLIKRLWTPDGAQVLEPPEAIRDEAARLGFPNATLTVRGHDELMARVTRAYDEFVAPGEIRFAARGEPRLVGDLLTFGWETVAIADGGPAGGGGTEMMVLTPDGRIAVDYQLIDR